MSCLKSHSGQVVVAHNFNPSTREQRQADICEFKTSLGYIQGEFQNTQNYTEKPCLQEQKQNKTKLKLKGIEGRNRDTVVQECHQRVSRMNTLWRSNAQQ